MGEITGEIIKSAIARNIKQNIKLADNFKIYKERTVQNMSKPCFFIWEMDVGQAKQMRNQYTRDYQMNIRFHAKEDSSKLFEQLSNLGNQLLESLALLQVPLRVLDPDSNQVIEGTKPVKGVEMSFNIVENVLQVYVTYTIRMKKVLDELPIIQKLDIEIIQGGI